MQTEDQAPGINGTQREHIAAAARLAQENAEKCKACEAEVRAVLKKHGVGMTVIKQEQFAPDGSMGVQISIAFTPFDYEAFERSQSVLALPEGAR